MPVKRWRTSDMIRMLRSVRQSASTRKRTEDSTSTLLILDSPETGIMTIFGIVLEGKTIPTPDDCGIELVRVNPALPSPCYEEVCLKLRRMGFTVE